MLSQPTKEFDLKNYLYLFFVDHSRLNYQAGKYIEYEKREPDYTSALLDAYQYMYLKLKLIIK